MNNRALTTTINFNPRSRKGSDCPNSSASVLPDYFNPRSRKGSDCVEHIASPLMFLISIHAPAKGATRMVKKGSPKKGFQSTLPQRERLDSTGALYWAVKFQSTLPQRERHNDIISLSLTREISIHAPAKGATGACNGKRYDD